MEAWRNQVNGRGGSLRAFVFSIDYCESIRRSVVTLVGGEFFVSLLNICVYAREKQHDTKNNKGVFQFVWIVWANF